MNNIAIKAALITLLLLTISCFGRNSVEANLISDAALQEPIDFKRVDYDRLGEAVVRMTNAVRQRQGRSELESSRLLARASRKYAKRMVDKQFLAHEDPFDAKLRTPADRVRAVGGGNAKTAENIADVPGFKLESGQPFYILDPAGPVIALTPEGPPVEKHSYASFAAVVVEGWMNSPGHRRNLLSADAVEVGVGAAVYQQNQIPSFIVVQKFQQYEPLR